MSHAPRAQQFASADELMTWAAGWAGKLEAGDHLGLIGELGVGKTTFIQGLARGMGSQLIPTSPTFSLRHRYLVTSHPTIKELVHVDLYRLIKAAEIFELGLTEDFQAPATLVAVEWLDRAPQLRPFLRYLIYFTIHPSGGRTVQIETVR